MKKLLLIGASGQLGTQIFRKLIKVGYRNIRILVREDSCYQHLLPDQPEVVVGDLRDIAAVRQALAGIEVVITTANSAAPRKKEDNFTVVDTRAYLQLIEEAKKQQLTQFIYTSAKPASPFFDRWVPLSRSKRTVETYLKKSGLPYTIFQPDAFMDVYFTFMGTSLPVLGDEAPLVERNFKFMQTFYNSVRNDIDQGKIGIIGSGKVKHSYITVENTAEFFAKAVDNPDMINRTIPLGGPEALSALELKAIFEKVLSRELTVKRTPAWVMKLLGNLLAPFNGAASNIMKLNYLAATEESIIDSAAPARKLGIRLTTAEEFLREKLAVRANKSTLSQPVSQ